MNWELLVGLEYIFTYKRAEVPIWSSCVDFIDRDSSLICIFIKVDIVVTRYDFQSGSMCGVMLLTRHNGDTRTL